MRPDEHKKRKNTQYKKKHGIKEKAESSDKKKEKTKDVSKCEGATRKPENTHKPKPLVDQDSDSDEQAFRRRGLVSNWSRYEDLPSDDDAELPSHRGEDFNKLIDAAGGSSAQFRFHDEEGWETSADSSDVIASVLTMNIEDLHQGLSCIPLHQRLGISESLFSESQLTEMTEAAATQDSLRENTLGTKTDHISDSKKHLSDESGNVNQTCAIINKSASVDLVNGHIEKKIDNNETQIQANFVKLDSDLTKAKKKEPPQKQFDRPDPLTNVDTNSHTACASNMVSDRKKALKQDDDTSCLEDDLDMLLSFDKPKNAQKTVQNGTNVQEHLIDSATVNGSDMHVTKGASSTELFSNSAVKKPSQKSTKKENLEDWLDSMLDD